MKYTLEIANPFKIPFSFEQGNAYAAIMRGRSVVVPACAGAGKSYLARGTGKNYNGNVESVPFGRALADEEIGIYKDFPNIRSLNFHRRGMRLCGAGVEVDSAKVKDIAVKYDPDYYMAITNLVTAMKREGYGIYEKALPVEEIAAKYGIDEEFIDKAKLVLADSDNMKGLLDFEDMLRFPVLAGRRETLTGLIILDEVQDYTPLAWQFLRDCLLTKDSHVLMIGDPERQMLMSFVGASTEIFSEMATYFNCETHKLTVNRRCSQNVVANAPFKGDMVALPDAPMGEYGHKEMTKVIEEIMDGKYENDAVLSEANAPLVQMGLNLLTKKIPCRMRVTRLENLIMRHAFRFLDTRKCPLGEIAIRLTNELKESMNDGEEISNDRQDVINCIAALESYCLAQQILKTKFMKVGRKLRPIHPIQQALEMLLTSDKGITLLTGHTAKGLEWNTVFHLPAAMKAPKQDWQEHQQNCLAHVIGTRARLNHYILSLPATTVSPDGDDGESEALEIEGEQE